jgi:predicted RNase H-like HicB family nuclease
MSAEMETPHYSMHIEWSPEDQAYVVILPEWADRYAMPVADGETIEEAATRGRNALENYIKFAQEDGVPLPAPRQYAGTGA